jgi:hypothetical protein
VTPRRLALAAAVVAFLGVSALVARWLAADARERAAVVRLLEAQARGDAAAMAAELTGCEARCRATAGALAERLDGPGEVEVVRYDSATARALGAETGPTRVVWQRGTGGADALPTVQCVTVRRTGSALAGPQVDLVAIGPPIGREAGC